MMNMFGSVQNTPNFLLHYKPVLWVITPFIFIGVIWRVNVNIPTMMAVFSRSHRVSVLNEAFSTFDMGTMLGAKFRGCTSFIKGFPAIKAYFHALWIKGCKAFFRAVFGRFSFNIEFFAADLADMFHINNIHWSTGGLN